MGTGGGCAGGAEFKPNAVASRGICGTALSGEMPIVNCCGKVAPCCLVPRAGSSAGVKEAVLTAVESSRGAV